MIDITIKNLDATIKKYENRIERMEDSSKAMEIISIMAHRDVMDHFNKEEGENGKWSPLQKSTLKAKSPKTGILKDTGQLRLSIRGRSLKNEAHVYTNVKYAEPHHTGAKFFPRRKFLWLSNMAKLKISQFLLKFYSEV